MTDDPKKKVSCDKFYQMLWNLKGLLCVKYSRLKSKKSLPLFHRSSLLMVV